MSEHRKPAVASSRAYAENDTTLQAVADRLRNEGAHAEVDRLKTDQRAS